MAGLKSGYDQLSSFNQLCNRRVLGSPDHAKYTDVGGHYFFMKILLIIISLATVHTASGQGDNQKDLVDILNVALRDNKLPNELINPANPQMVTWTNAPFIIVKSDKEKNISRLLNPTESDHVWIIDYAEIFELSIPYGLVPIKIKRKKNRLTLDYKVVKYPSKYPNFTCHSSRLTAERNEGLWIIINSTTKETKCEIDMYGHKK
jgi:hypothetical protein